MSPPLVSKTWRDDRRAVIGWAVGVAAFTAIYTGFYSQFQGTAQFKQDALPKEMLDFLGVADMVSPAGYLQATVFSLIGPALVLMAATSLAARAIARAEEDGGMELLLTTPVSRLRFAAQRLAATGAAATAVAAVPWLVLVVVVPTIGIDISLSNVTAACAGLIALIWCFTGIAFLTGAATGRRGHVLAVTGTLAVASYLANAIAGLAGTWSWLRWLSPFHYFIGTDPLNTGWHPAHLLVLAGVGAVTATAGLAAFDRRDIAA